jgi:hypothetical protein
VKVETEGEEEEEEKKPSTRAKRFRKSRLFWYHIISPPGDLIDLCASLGNEEKW